MNGALLQQAIAAHQAGRIADAEKLYLEVLSTSPADFSARHLLGVIRAQQGRNAEALALIEGALQANPRDANALANHGNVLKAMDRPGDALASYDKALAADPGNLVAWHNRGAVLHQLQRYPEALASYDKALALRPDHAQSLTYRGNTLRHLKQSLAALASYDRALALNSGDAVALNNRGNALFDLKRFEEALESYARAAAISPGYAVAQYNCGNAAQSLGLFAKALEYFEAVLSRDPAHLHALGGAANAVLKSCDWAKVPWIQEEIEKRAGQSVIPPFVVLGYDCDAAIQRQCASTFIHDRMRLRPAPLWQGSPYRHDRIRIAYLSCDFRQHPVSYQAVELFEKHDRARFDVTGISLANDDHSDIRARIVGSFDQFHDASAVSDLEVAALLRRLEIDIAVDLSGLTQDARPEILGHRPAPVQVNYLGYSGTMGADYMDYIIADDIAVPFDQRPFFAEKIVHLPDCFMINSAKFAAPSGLTRKDAGLPEGRFVFCCFNNCWKITAPVFDAWMRLLQAVPGSILWLKEPGESVKLRLRREAGLRGVEPQRLIFAGRARMDNYFARYRLADLFLDTLPYNAHATASDALSMGLPLITTLGHTFASRIAASLLHAAGLPELATLSLKDYEALALRLADDAGLLQSCRTRLEKNHLTRPLFDSGLFTRRIEAAFEAMWQAAESGKGPQSFRAG